jgi:hypothetical protein
MAAIVGTCMFLFAVDQMIKILSESLIAIGKVPSQLPGRPHISTIWRWINRGCRGVRLETILIGGKRYTSLEALQRFVEATTVAAERSPANTAVTAPSRRRDIGKANSELDAAGI